MGTNAIRCASIGGLLAVTGLLGGCAGEQQRPLYYWGDYQEQVYHYFKAPGDAPQAELAKLGETEQLAASKNAALPPGFNAHLGLLYLKAGQGDKARTAFLTEEAQFPESRPYMDFLLKKKGATIDKPTSPAAAKSLPAKPGAKTAAPAAVPAAGAAKAGDAK